MSKRNQYNATEKLAIIQEYEMGEVSGPTVAQKHDINISTLEQSESEGLSP